MTKTLATMFAGLVLTIGAAQASEIPETMLAADMQQCLAMSENNPGLTEKQINDYCTCTVDLIRQRMDLQTYVEFGILAQGGKPGGKGLEILSKVAAECINLHLK